MSMAYDNDVHLWSRGLASRLRQGFDALDLAQVADQVEDMGNSGRRTLGSRLGMLVGDGAHPVQSDVLASGPKLGKE